MVPRVTLHNAVSLDGRLLEWGMVDFDMYYGLVGAFAEQATLVGSETMLAGAAHEGVIEDRDEAPAIASAPEHSRPLLIVPDSRGRVRIWRWMLAQPYWRAGVAICTASTPAEYLAYLKRSNVDVIMAGRERVDLAVALTEVRERYGIERIRVDSGGMLNGALLRLGLVSEVSLLIAPVLMGDDRSRPFYRVPEGGSPDCLTRLKMTHHERLDGDNLWLRYEVVP